MKMMFTERSRAGHGRRAVRRSLFATYDREVASERLTISLDPELAADVRDAAEADSRSVSSWLADAARRRLLTRGLGALLDEWEAEHGAFTPAELAEARARLKG